MPRRAPFVLGIVPLDLIALRGELIRAMARMAFVTEWSHLQEDLRAAGRKAAHPGPGGDWFDIAPKTTPTSALVWAENLAAAFETTNRAPLAALYWHDLDQAGILHTPRHVARWGHTRALEAMGHGTSWTDDYGYDSNVKVPSRDFYL